MSDLQCPLREAALSDPNLPALEAPDRRLTFRELDEWVEGTASQLRACGTPGEQRAERPVALWMENDWRLVVLLLATLRAGVVVCPLSTRLPSVDEALAQIGAQMLISDRAGTRPDVLLKQADGGGSAVHPPEQPATIVFTSGSSGRPKAALLSFGNHYFNALGSNANIAVEPGDRWLVSLPLYHVGGFAILFRCLLGRGTIVLQDDGAPAETAAGVTHMSFVSTQLLRLIRSEASLPHLKAILLGGSAMPPGLIEEAIDHGLPIHTSYGMTEMASQVATTPAGASREELLTSGHVLSYRELTVTTEGEILVRGKTRFMGYVEGRELVEPFEEGGWYATGDVGFVENGYLRIMGRLDNMFISGGENVMPEEIERVLTSRADIRRAVVVPVEDEEFGRRPVAFLEMAENAPGTGEIRKWLAGRLPRFKIPVRFFPWPEGGGGSGLKVDRAFLERRADVLMEE